MSTPTLPPYNQIDGIFTTDDKHQDITKAAYDGQARPGQLVIDTTDYQVYVSNADGILNAVAASGNGTTGGSNTQIQFNDAGNFAGNNALRFNKVTGVTTISDAVIGDLQITGNITGDLLPDANITYDLGSATQRWRDLWLSGTTINLGPQTISSNSTAVIFAGTVEAPSYAGDGSALFNIEAANIIGNIPQATQADTANISNVANTALSVAGANVVGAVGNANVALRAATVTTAAQPNITSVGTLADLTTAGNINTAGEIIVANDNGHGGPGYAGIMTMTNLSAGATTPNKFVRVNIDGNLQIVNSAYNAAIFNLADTGKLTVGSADLGDVAGVTIQGGISGQVLTTDGSGNLQWATAGGGGGGGLPLANGTSAINIPVADGDIEFTVNGTSQWALGETAMTLPSGGTIGEAPIPAPFPGYAVAITPTGTIDADQQLMVYPTAAGDFNHLHLTTGNLFNTELYLGNDDLYVKLANTGNIEINANDNNGANALWTFDATGNLTLPTNSFTVNYANGTPVPLGGGSGPLPPYKGFKATYGRMYDEEPTISKLVIYKDTVTPSSIIDTTTEDDDFAVLGLTGSDIVLLINIYGSSTTTPTPLSTLLTFMETVVDTVILDGGVEGDFNDIATMQSLFYSEIGTLTAAAGDLYSNFQFYVNQFDVTSQGTLIEGSGAVFGITDNGNGTYTALDLQSPGINYQVGHKILVLGTDLGGASPANDCTITVTAIDPGGEISNWSVSGTAAGSVVATYGPVTGTNYQVGSGLVISRVNNYNGTEITLDLNNIGTNYVVGDLINLPGTSYNNGVSPANDLVITVTSVGSLGEVFGLSASGTTPQGVWPTNFIADGGDDQYDDGNYINTDIETEIPYNAGVIVTDSSAFGGPGSNYAMVYADSIFGVLVTGAAINVMGTGGGSGFDGNGTADTGDLFAGSGIDLGDFVFSGGTMTATSEDIYIKSNDDLFLDALGDDVHIRSEDTTRIRTGYNFTDNIYQTEWRFGNEGNLVFNKPEDGGEYGVISMNQLDSQKRLQIVGESAVGIGTIGTGSEWNFLDGGILTIPGTTYADTSPISVRGDYGFIIHPSHNTGGTGPELAIYYNDGILITPLTNDYLVGGDTAAPLYIEGTSTNDAGVTPGSLYLVAGTNTNTGAKGDVVIGPFGKRWTYGPEGVNQSPVLTVATLPAPVAGGRSFVSDSTVAAAGNFGAVVAGGGAITVPVWSDGTDWLIG